MQNITGVAVVKAVTPFSYYPSALRAHATDVTCQGSADRGVGRYGGCGF